MGKPRKDKQPCVRCGKCCKGIPCGVGYYFLGDHRPCKALEGKRKPYSCGLMTHPSKYINLGGGEKWRCEFIGNLISRTIGEGEGCGKGPSTAYIEKVVRWMEKYKLINK